MRFKYWLHLQEAIDQNTENALSYQKQRVDPKEFDDFIDQLKNDPDPIDRGSAFDKLKEKFPILITDKKKEKFSIEAPIDPFFKEYYNQLISKQITKPEYDTLLFFKDKSQGSLSEMMESLRSLIYQKKIELNFINNIPTIVYQNEAIPNKDFLQFTGMLHKIEGLDATKPSNNNLADPFFLEVSHKEKLVAKSADGTIWVFKATGPLDCRLMGKGQSWCISSSSSAEWYFNYRHDHGQTQYFIFDFNKDENDSARYVNPGIAPESGYSEWVDTRNNPNNINGYSSVQEYKNYLKDKGIDIGVFVADPLTEEEKLLSNSSGKYGNSSSSGKDDIFQQFKEGQYKELFDKFIETMSFLDVGLMEKHFNQLSDQQRNFYLSNVGGDGLGYLLQYSSNKDKLIDQIFPYVKDKLDSEMVHYLLLYSKKPDELIKQIFPYVKDKLDSEMVHYLLQNSSKKDELIKQIFPYVKDKLDSNMVKSLLDASSDKDELIKQILPYVEDKLNRDMINFLLGYSKKSDEMINQIVPLIKDKLDSNMVGYLFSNLSEKNHDELINQIFPYVKDKLDIYMVKELLRYSSKQNRDELISQIFPLVKDKLDSDMVGNFIHYSSDKNAMISQIFPYVEDKLDRDMVGYLLFYSLNKKDELVNQILPLVEDDLDFMMVRSLLNASSKKDELINRILPLVKDDLDSRLMVKSLLDASSEPDELKKRIDDIKFGAKE